MGYCLDCWHVFVFSHWKQWPGLLNHHITCWELGCHFCKLCKCLSPPSYSQFQFCYASENPEKKIKARWIVFAQHLCVSFTQWVIRTPPILLTIHCCVCVYKVIWTFYYKEPRLRVGGSFTIFVSESWKQSRSLAHKEKSTSLSAWKHNTGAEQSIVVHCLRTCVLSSCMLSKPKGPRALHST